MDGPCHGKPLTLMFLKMCTLLQQGSWRFFAPLVGQEDPSLVLKMSLSADVTYFNDTTRNLIVESDTGNPDNVVVVGSHIDSVPAGPGIDDDGGC